MTEKTKKVYYLNDSDGMIIAKFEFEADPSIIGKCWSAIGWIGDDDTPVEWEFVADVYCKWDGCTHWNFWGEDYDPEIDNKEEKDSYYHLCGCHCFANHIRYMCFIWKVSEMVLSKSVGTDDYYDSEEIKNLIELMLKDYTIEEGEVDA